MHSPNIQYYYQYIIDIDINIIITIHVSAVQGIKRTSNLMAPTMQLTGHAGEVLALQYNPDGDVLASGSFDKEVFLWRAFGENKNYSVLKVSSRCQRIFLGFFTADRKVLFPTRFVFCPVPSFAKPLAAGVSHSFGMSSTLDAGVNPTSPASCLDRRGGWLTGGVMRLWGWRGGAQAVPVVCHVFSCQKADQATTGCGVAVVHCTAGAQFKCTQEGASTACAARPEMENVAVQVPDLLGPCTLCIVRSLCGDMHCIVSVCDPAVKVKGRLHLPQPFRLGNRADRSRVDRNSARHAPPSNPHPTPSNHRVSAPTMAWECKCTWCQGPSALASLHKQRFRVCKPSLGGTMPCLVQSRQGWELVAEASLTPCPSVCLSQSTPPAQLDHQASGHQYTGACCAPQWRVEHTAQPLR